MAAAAPNASAGSLPIASQAINTKTGRIRFPPSVMIYDIGLYNPAGFPFNEREERWAENMS
jgi:hypothetical protein